MVSRFGSSCVVAASLALAVSLATPASARNENGKWRILPVGPGSRPEARKHHTIVFDPVSNSVYLYGGETEDDEVLDDLWRLDLDCEAGWEELSVSGGPATGRHGHSAAYAGSPPRMIIFGGRSNLVPPSDPQYAASFLSDTWSLSLGSPPAWSLISAGPDDDIVDSCSQSDYPFRPRTHSSVVYFQDDLFMFAGRDVYGTGMNDTWKELIPEGQWIHRSGKTNPTAGGHGCPPVTHRYWHTMIVDESRAVDRIVVYGGEYDTESSSDVYTTVDGVQWTLMGVALAPEHTRLFHAAIYDPHAKRMVIVGGYRNPGPSDIVDAVTAFNLDYDCPNNGCANAQDWSVLSTSGTGPGPAAEHAAVYDSSADRMIVFGGVTTGGAFRDDEVWALEFEDIPPAAATITVAKGKTTAAIAWLAPGDDGSSGTACHYDVRRATFPITAANFHTATPVTAGLPQPAGSEECVRVTGLSSCQTYWYALKTIDESGNVSALSNVVSKTQNCSGGEVDCAGSSAPAAARGAPPTIEYRLAGRNPAVDASSLSYGIPAGLAGRSLEISIFDVAGRRVRTIERGPARAGEHAVAWDHRRSDGGRVAPGVYFARLQVGEVTQTQKIVVGWSK